MQNKKFSFAALATDGRDFLEGVMGAWANSEVGQYLREGDINCSDYIDATDTYHLHEKLGTLVEGFYTGTNVSDFYLYAFEK